MESLPVSKTTFVGNLYLDAQILRRVDLSDLPKIGCVNSTFQRLIQSDTLWDLIIQDKYGKKVLTLKDPQISSKEIWNQLSCLPANSAGYNLALMRNSSAAIRWFQMLKISPNLENHFPSRPSLIFRASSEFLEFCQNIDFGPQIIGSFSPRKPRGPNPHMYSNEYVNKDSIQPLVGSNLKDLLYTLQPQINGQANPLYGLLSRDLATGFLFKHFKQFGNWDRNERFTASPEMRKYLPNLMTQTIDRQIDLSIKNFQRAPSPKGYGGIEIISYSRVLLNIQQKLHQAIIDPTIEVEDCQIFGQRDSLIFNPNKFKSSEILSMVDTLISQKRLTSEELELLRPTVSNLFSHLESASSPSNVENLIYLQFKCFRLASSHAQQKRESLSS